ncbi:MAG: 3-dehydroquinate synthase [Planctomycetes bacterium]|nr:3-dehydroquinate synthase [Planctomycetota bacterium]
MHPARVSVNLGTRSYDVVIGHGILAQLRAALEALRPTTIFMVTDSNVGALHSAAVRAVVQGIAPMQEHAVPAGEASKCLSQLGALYDAALGARKLDRRAVVLALGGGVVGDLAGFAAATLLRGLPSIQLPTSLLAMVDSSVGGKAAINHTTGKNLIGAFQQPVAVICELAFLETLPQREYTSALAEVVKTAALAGDELMGWLESRTQAILIRDHGALAQLLQTCVAFKARVVEQDETETTGRRAILNLGHSLAHVLETAWPGRYLHGEAVSIGLAAALRLSTQRANLKQATAQRVAALLQALGLPIDAPADLPPDRLLQLLASDKKRDGANVNFVVLGSLGNPQLLPCTLDDSLAETLLGIGHG